MQEDEPPRKRRHHSDGTKQAAIRRVVDDGEGVKAVARDLGVDHRTVWVWIDAARKARIDPDGSLPAGAVKRIQELEKRNLELERELLFQKKAQAFFQELDRGKNDSR